MAGVILSDSFLAAYTVAKCRVVNRRRRSAPLPSRRRIVVPLFHCSWMAVFVALNGEACATAAGSRLSASSVADATSRCPGGRALISARRRIVVSPVGRFSPAPGILLLSSRVEELLNSLCHVATHVALELV